MTQIPIDTGQDASAMEDFRALGLSNDDINALFRVFCKFDIIGDGELEYAEFTVQCKIEESKISREIFHDINTDNDAGISFREFVVSLWLYLVKTKEALAEFAFDLFDTDNSSRLTHKELEEMVSIVYGRADLGGQIKKVLQEMDRGGDGMVSKKEFVDHVRKFPALLFPAFELQDQLRKAVCGEDFWMRKTATAATYLKSEHVQEIIHAKRAKAKKLTNTVVGHRHNIGAGSKGTIVSKLPTSKSNSNQKSSSKRAIEPDSGSDSEGNSDDEEDDDDNDEEEEEEEVITKTKSKAKATAHGKKMKGR